LITPVDWSVNDATSGAVETLNAAMGTGGRGGFAGMHAASASAATAITPMSARR
jgi:hypothetical protein